MASKPNTVIVDDQDSSISYQGLWSENGSSINYNSTSYSPRDTGAQMSFTFNGSSIAVVGDIGAGGTCNATFTIDGNVEYYSSPLLTTAQHQQTLWTSPQLSNSEHTLVYTVTACKSGQNTEATSSFLWFDYLLYNTSEVPLGRTLFIDDRDERVVYSGNWIKDGGDGDFRLTRQGGRKGSSFEFVFTGSYISVNGRLENSTSMTHVSFALDGDTPITHGYPPQNFVSYNKELFTNTSLLPGVHSLTVTSLSDTPFYFDYILIRDPYFVSKDSKNSFPVGGAVGIGLGALGVIVVIFAIVFYCRRQRASRRQPKAPDKSNASTAGEVIHFPSVSRMPNFPSTPSTQSITGLLLVSPDPFSSLSSPTVSSFADDTLSHHEPLRIEGDYWMPADNLPPEYSTTASSGLNIGWIPPSPGHNSVYSGSSSTQFPPSRSHTLSSMHHRHNSGPFDITSEEHIIQSNDSRIAQASRSNSSLVPRRALPSTPGSPLRPHVGSDIEDPLYLRKMKALERDGYGASLPSSHSRGLGNEAPLSPLRRHETGNDVSDPFASLPRITSRSHLSAGQPSTLPSSPESGVRSPPHTPRLRTVNPEDDNTVRAPELKGKQRMMEQSEGSSSHVSPIVHVDSGIRLTAQTGSSPATDAPFVSQHPTPSSRPSTASTYRPSYPPSRPDSGSVYSRLGTASTIVPSRPNTATSTVQNHYNAQTSQQPLVSTSDHTRVEDSDPLEIPPMYTPN